MVVIKSLQGRNKQEKLTKVVELVGIEHMGLCCWAPVTHCSCNYHGKSLLNGQE